MEAYRPQGTCSRQILFNVNEEGILTDLKFLGGCTGGLQALIRFTVGKPIAEVINLCDGIKCKNETSCPDQLAYALKHYMKQKQQETLTPDPIKHRGHPRILDVH